MQEIAERADVSLRTVYNHYPTTDDLVVGCGGKVMALLAPPTPEIFDGRRVDSAKMRPVARLGGPYYAALGEIFNRPRLHQPPGGAPGLESG
jgi:hypothetical protein